MCTVILSILVACAATEEQAALSIFPVKDVKAACEFWKTACGITLELAEPLACPDGNKLVRARDKAAGVELAFLVQTVVQKPAPLPRACIRIPVIAAIVSAFPDAPRFAVGDTTYVLLKDPDGNLFFATGQTVRGELLFNGKDLAGWHTFRTGKWSVKDGTIFGEQGPDNGGGWLLTDASYKDFTLTFAFRISKGANSGVCVRYVGDGAPPQTAVEVNLSEDEPENPTGSLLGIRKAPASLIKDDWNTAMVRIEGNLVVSFINGKEAARETIARLKPEGQIGFQAHGTARYAGMTVEIKDVVVNRR